MSFTLIAQAEPLQGETAPTPAPVQEAEGSEESGAGPAVAPEVEPEAALLTPDGVDFTPPEQLTAGVGLPSAPPQDMSLTHMFFHADFVVQAVMLLLFLASVATWVVIFEKFLILRRAGRQILQFKRASDLKDWPVEANDFSDLTQLIVKAGLGESAYPAEDETKSEYRERIERSMRAELAGLMDRLSQRTLFLASVGSVSPFVGLFGTVWGIMHSFIGIAASGETTLAVVAPGIAEALFATAMGLVAAIPAVVAYNKINGILKQFTKETLAGIGQIGNRLARQNYKKVRGA